MILDKYLKTLSSVDLRKQFYDILNVIWACVPDGLLLIQDGDQKPWKSLFQVSSA